MTSEQGARPGPESSSAPCSVAGISGAVGVGALAVVLAAEVFALVALAGVMAGVVERRSAGHGAIRRGRAVELAVVAKPSRRVAGIGGAVGVGALAVVLAAEVFALVVFAGVM